MLDLKGLWQYNKVPYTKYVTIALYGKFKGENNEKYHLLPCVHVTSSGIKVKKWMTRILEAHRQLGRKDGPAISDFKGVITSSAQLNSLFHETLNELYEEDSALFPATIKRVLFDY